MRGLTTGRSIRPVVLAATASRDRPWNRAKLQKPRSKMTHRVVGSAAQHPAGQREFARGRSGSGYEHRPEAPDETGTSLRSLSQLLDLIELSNLVPGYTERHKKMGRAADAVALQQFREC